MRDRTWHRSVLAAGIAGSLLLLVLTAVACSDDEPEGGTTTTDRSGQTTSTTVAPPSTTSTTEPPSSDEAAVRPVIDGLLGAWDEAMTPILADPEAVTTDPTTALAEPLEEIFTADSPYVSDFGEFLSSGYVGQDLGIRTSGAQPVQDSHLLRLTDVPDEDHLSFVFCSFNDGESFHLSSGEHWSSDVGITQGAGEAVRVDGQWKLHRLRQLTFTSEPEGTANPCPGLVAPITDTGQ